MGAAAYRRGSARIRADIDARLACARSNAPLACDAELRAELEELRAWQSRARRSLAVLRLTVTQERADARAAAERAHTERMELVRALEASRGAHRRLSAIVRATLTPAQYHAARRELELERRPRPANG